MSFFNRKFLAEFLGTTVFLTAIVGANAAGTFTQTGAQANPAVSLALIFAGHNFTDQALTVIAEFLGMLLAVALLLVINRKEPKPTRKKVSK